MSQILLEVCVASVTDSISAERAGADRLELNMGLELGGLTPGLQLMKQVRAAVSIPVIVMIRPRAAGFCYSQSEKQVMLADARELLECGADGIASGCLNSDATIDVAFWKQLVELTREKDAVFHRAFDVVQDRAAALEQLIDCGTTRVLTSGGMPTVSDGAQKISALVEQANGRIEILPGSGVNADNICKLLEQTGCNQMHGSFKTMAADAAGVVAEDSYPTTSSDLVALARSRLNEIT